MNERKWKMMLSVGLLVLCYPFVRVYFKVKDWQGREGKSPYCGQF